MASDFRAAFHVAATFQGRVLHLQTLIFPFFTPSTRFSLSPFSSAVIHLQGRWILQILLNDLNNCMVEKGEMAQ